jgi:hypothetical protein
VTMRVGNGSKVNVVAIGTLPLWLSSRLILVLNKCYYVPILSMNIVCGSRVSRDGYFFKSVTNGCSIFKIIYFMFMHRIMMFYIFWILIVMNRISIVLMLKDANKVMIIPCICGIAVLVMLA